MNSRFVLRVEFGEDTPVGAGHPNSSHEVEEFDGLRRGQSLSVRRACDKLPESRGLKTRPSETLFWERRGIRTDFTSSATVRSLQVKEYVGV